MNFIIVTQAQATALINLIELIDGGAQTEAQAEAASVRVGGGIHAPWSMCRRVRSVAIRKHPTREEYAVKVTLLRKLWQAYQAGTLPPSVVAVIASLTDAQRLAIRNAIRDAVDLTDDWKPASGIG
jgi:hypothetical protein